MEEGRCFFDFDAIDKRSDAMASSISRSHGITIQQKPSEGFVAKIGY
jgi:hypothetical protein